jgi:cobaltochelatase CobN
MWADPDPELLGALQQAYLDTEGDLEGGETPAQQGASA